MRNPEGDLIFGSESPQGSPSRVSSDSGPGSPCYKSFRPDLSNLKELSPILYDPVDELLSGQSKKVRSSLLFASAGLCRQNPLSARIIESCRWLAEVMEHIHAGSLIIDDIQDGSELRRGKPAVHTKLGIPLAINAGNWLYFEALRLIPAAQLEPLVEVQVQRLCHQALFDGHLGQALDVGLRIDQMEQSRVPMLCRASMHLKSGALMSLAAQTGALVAQAPASLREAAREFGESFGCALQRFNDLREFSALGASLSRDLCLRRPSWLWSVAAQTLSEPDYAKLRNRAGGTLNSSLANCAPLAEAFQNFGLVEKARLLANENLESCLTDFAVKFSHHGVPLDGRAEWLDILSLSAKLRNTHE